MITKDIEVVHQLAEELVKAIPADISVNSRGEFYMDGEKIDTMIILASIEVAGAKAEELQKILLEKLVARKRQ